MPFQLSSSSRASSPSSDSSYSTSSEMSSSLYIPVHKRSSSRGSSTVTTPTSGSFTESSLKDFGSVHPVPRYPFYTPGEMLSIREHSTLVHDALEEDALHALFKRLPVLYKEAEESRGRSPRRRHHPKKAPSPPEPHAAAAPDVHAFPLAFTRQRPGRVRPGRPGVRGTQPPAMKFMDEPSWRHAQAVPLSA
ncbi:hypothetical protein BDZ89DRAFT_1158793 [Hymenopellis radicata]|nr:hypothetical protein BDZ89DRAFT_1158793 [Hymenopellis radicata]